MARADRRRAGERAGLFADWAEASGEEALAQAARAHLIEIDADAIRGRRRAAVSLARALSRQARRDRQRARRMMVHAHDGAAVAEVAIAPWWRRRLAYAFRFPGVTD